MGFVAWIVIEGVKGKEGWKTYMFDESTLVLEGVTLAEVVELVVEVLVDLARSAVFDQKAAKDTETAHPHDLTILHHSVLAKFFRISFPP